MAQLRTGILPLNLEVGRFKNILEDERLCELCELNEVENESHFLLYCPLYDELRTPISTEMSQKFSGALMMIEWTGCLTLMSLSLLNMYLKPGKSIRMVYMFNCSNVC